MQESELKKKFKEYKKPILGGGGVLGTIGTGAAIRNITPTITPIKTPVLRELSAVKGLM